MRNDDSGARSDSEAETENCAGRERRWRALCDVCHWSMADAAYQAAEKAAGPTDDPRCPRCNRCLWSFHPEEG